MASFAALQGVRPDIQNGLTQRCGVIRNAQSAKMILTKLAYIATALSVRMGWKVYGLPVRLAWRITAAPRMAAAEAAYHYLVPPLTRFPGPQLVRPSTWLSEPSSVIQPIRTQCPCKCAATAKVAGFAKLCRQHLLTRGIQHVAS